MNSRTGGRSLLGARPTVPTGRRAVLIGLLAALVVVAALLVAFRAEAGRIFPLGWGPPAPGPVVPASVGEIEAGADAFLGRRVRVTGTIGLVLGPQGFLIRGPGPWPNPELAVVSPKPLRDLEGMPEPAFALEGLPVQVTGVVRRFYFRPVERELGVDLSEALFVRYVGQPAIVATAVTAG